MEEGLPDRLLQRQNHEFLKVQIPGEAYLQLKNYSHQKSSPR
jgi:hypothetical protein